MSLKGKVAIVTGSTSGIGLGIAHALAAEGADIMLNGFGPADSIDKSVRDLAERHHVRVRHSAADMTRPAEIESLVSEAAFCVRRAPHSGQQCRHPAHSPD